MNDSRDLPTPASPPPRRARRAPRLLALVALALLPLLAACEITISGTWPPVDFAVTSASYTTDTRMVVDGIEDSVICDDRTTEVTYTFEYEGTLLSWRSYFRGVLTGDIRGDATFVPGDPRVDVLGLRKLSVTYYVAPGSAPLLQADTPTMSPQITVEPVVLGYSVLHLDVEGVGTYVFGTQRESDAIPVVQSCGA